MLQKLLENEESVGDEKLDKISYRAEVGGC